MWGLAQIALLLLLPISHDALVSRKSPLDHVGHDSRSAGRMLRGPFESASLEAVKNRGRENARNEETWHPSQTGGSDGPGHLRLFETCYMTDDCAPGIFTEADFRTRCETTPFSSGGNICCKPFATPCDSHEACCSGNCDNRYTRCDDAIAPPDQDRATNKDSDSVEASADAISEDNPVSALDGDQNDTDDQYDGAQYDELANNDDAQYTGLGLDDDEVPYDELAQNDDGSYDTATGDAGSDDQLVQENPLEDPDPLRRPSRPANSSDEVDPDSPGKLPEKGKGKPQAPRPPPHGEGGTTVVGGGSDGDRDSDADDGGKRQGSRTNATGSCEADYSSGIIRTVAKSNARVEAVGMDSQGNVFYALGAGNGKGDTIRKASPLSVSGANQSDGDIQQANDTLIYTGTGVILAIAVDADDNLVFTMEDAPTVSGGVFWLRMAPGGRVASQQQPSGANHGSDDGPAASESEFAPAVALAADLGPFLPGVAVCPVTGDIYVTRGHSGVARLVKGADGSFDAKMKWSMEDMTFRDGGKSRAPLMVWDIAVTSQGIAFFTTYVQGVVLKGIFPRLGGNAQVRLAAGKWDSGVVPSSGDGGRALSALLSYPKGIAIDGQDKVYVAEFQGGKIRKIDHTDIISTCAGTGRVAYEGDDGPASGAGFDLPNAIAFMPGKTVSNMAVADFGHNAVRVITPLVSCA